MYRTFQMVLLALTSSAIWAEAGLAEPQWQITGACAAGYLANWENRMTIRGPSMSNSIELQAEDYKTAAIRLYQKEVKTSPEEAKRTVEAYIADNVSRFIAMDKAGTLETFLDGCPEVDYESAN